MLDAKNTSCSPNTHAPQLTMALHPNKPTVENILMSEMHLIYLTY